MPADEPQQRKLRYHDIPETAVPKQEIAPKAPAA